MNSITSVVAVIIALLGLCNCDTSCDPSWYASNTQCYYIEQSKSVTRDQASQDCGNKQADLFRFSDPTELAYMQNQIKGFNSDGFWTDLTDLRFDGTQTGTGLWMWGQYLQLDNSTIPWEAYPTAENAASCGALNSQGNFANLQCTRRLGFVCEIDLPANGGCPENWLFGTNACYFISDTTNGTQLLTFTQAQQRCAAMAVPQGANAAHLLTIDKQSDADYLSSQVQYLTQTTTLFWTGLIRKAGGWAWNNMDPWNPQLINWVQEPDHLAGMEHCGTIRTDGKFTDQDCSKTFNYICQKGSTIVDSKYFFGCGGWDRADHKCYIFYEGPQTTWFDAKSRCQSMGANLMKIENMDEKRWLEWQMTMVDLHPNVYWSGLNDQAQEGVYAWADSTPADMSLIRWNQEPNDWFGNEDCASILMNGVYNDMDCTSQTGFICEYFNLLYQDGSGAPVCPNGWINLPGSRDCYYFGLNGTLTWLEANDYCHNQKIVSTTVPTTLLSVNSLPEKQFIEQQLGKLGVAGKGYWTALNDKNAEGQWLFYDSFNNPPDPNMIKWTGEPSDDGTKNEDCTFLLYGGRYFDTNCNNKFGFICEKYASGLSAGQYANSGSSSKMNIFTILLTVVGVLVKYNI